MWLCHSSFQELSCSQLTTCARNASTVTKWADKGMKIRKHSSRMCTGRFCTSGVGVGCMVPRRGGGYGPGRYGTTPSRNRQTRGKNIIFPELRLQAVLSAQCSRVQFSGLSHISFQILQKFLQMNKVMV